MWFVDVTMCMLVNEAVRLIPKIHKSRNNLMIRKIFTSKHFQKIVKFVFKPPDGSTDRVGRFVGTVELLYNGLQANLPGKFNLQTLWKECVI